jgi:hypothetical protein
VGKVRIRITLTRYEREKRLGKEYRADQSFTGSFSEFVKKKKKESKS